MDDRRVIIVGGGVVGVCCGYSLAKRGARVVVLEKEEIGAGASEGNAGTVAPGHPPINKPGRVRQAMRSLVDPLSPLYIPPRWDPALVRWFWTFSRRCTAAHLEYGMRVLAPLGLATRRLFDRLVTDEGLDCGYRQDGYYEVYRTEHGLQSAAEEASLVRAHGYHADVLDGTVLREREPSLRPEVRGGVWYRDAATVHPHRFVSQLAERAEGCGATVRPRSEVVGFVRSGGGAPAVRLRNGETVAGDAVVVAAGAHTALLLRELGVRLPLQGAKGYHRDLDIGEGRVPALRHTLMLGEASVFCTPLDGFVRFAGTLEFSGLNDVIRLPRLEQLTAAASSYLEGVYPGRARSEWCGLRPCLPDGLPAVGPVPGIPGLFVATGHAMLGLTLGPVTGQLIAESVLDGRPSLDLEALRVDRF